MNPVPVLPVPQYCLLRCLKTKGIPRDLRELFVARSGATEADWEALLAAGYVAEGKRSEKGRFVLTAEGKRVYNRRPKNLYF